MPEWSQFSGQRRLTLLVFVLFLCERTQSESYFIHCDQTVSRPTGGQTATRLITKVSRPKLCCTSDIRKKNPNKLSDDYFYMDIWF